MISNPLSTNPNAVVPAKTALREWKKAGDIIMKNIRLAVKEAKKANAVVKPTVKKVTIVNKISNVSKQKLNEVKSRIANPKNTPVVARVELKPTVEVKPSNRKKHERLSEVQIKALRADSKKLNARELSLRYGVSERSVYRILSQKVAN